MVANLNVKMRSIVGRRVAGKVGRRVDDRASTNQSGGGSGWMKKHIDCGAATLSSLNVQYNNTPNCSW